MEILLVNKNRRNDNNNKKGEIYLKWNYKVDRSNSINNMTRNHTHTHTVHSRRHCLLLNWMRRNMCTGLWAHRIIIRNLSSSILERRKKRKVVFFSLLSCLSSFVFYLRFWYYYYCCSCGEESQWMARSRVSFLGPLIALSKPFFLFCFETRIWKQKVILLILSVYWDSFLPLFFSVPIFMMVYSLRLFSGKRLNRATSYRYT